MTRVHEFLAKNLNVILLVVYAVTMIAYAIGLPFELVFLGIVILYGSTIWLQYMIFGLTQELETQELKSYILFKLRFKRNGSKNGESIFYDKLKCKNIPYGKMKEYIRGRLLAEKIATRESDPGEQPTTNQI